ncbi:MAG: hypothetical protein ACK5LT_12845 [Lachnospirales bacterium]
MEKDNRKHKDALFRYLFKEPKNFIELYEDITNRRIKEEDVRYFDTETYLMANEWRNDVSFLDENNKFIILL